MNNYGQYVVKNNQSSTFYFTDDGGKDFMILRIELDEPFEGAPVGDECNLVLRYIIVNTIKEYWGLSDYTNKAVAVYLHTIRQFWRNHGSHQVYHIAITPHDRTQWRDIKDKYDIIDLVHGNRTVRIPL